MHVLLSGPGGDWTKLTPVTRASASSRLATRNLERVALWVRH